MSQTGSSPVYRSWTNWWTRRDTPTKVMMVVIGWATIIAACFGGAIFTATAITFAAKMALAGVLASLYGFLCGGILFLWAEDR